MQTACFKRDAPVGERGLQFEAAAADVAQIAAEQTEFAIVGNGVPGLLNLLLVHQHASSENHGLRPLARGHQATLHQKNVNPLFQDSLVSHGNSQHTIVPAAADAPRYVQYSGPKVATRCNRTQAVLRSEFLTGISTLVLKRLGGKPSGKSTQRRHA